MRSAILCLIIIFAGFFSVAQAETEDGIPLLHAPINSQDFFSLQRGAQLYTNYCAGCHSLNFMRYNRLAKDLGIVDQKGKVNEQLVKDNLIFTGARISDPMQNAMRKEDAKIWFGVAPPDLSLIARARSADWLYNYLLSFYQDSSRPLGVNNLLFNETAMPDVLVLLRGVQMPIYQNKTLVVGGEKHEIRQITHLLVTESGTMSPQQFNAAVADIVNFLSYVSEPEKQQRESLGLWVLGYLILFAIVAFFLKKEFWKKVK